MYDQFQRTYYNIKHSGQVLNRFCPKLDQDLTKSPNHPCYDLVKKNWPKVVQIIVFAPNWITLVFILVKKPDQIRKSWPKLLPLLWASLDKPLKQHLSKSWPNPDQTLFTHLVVCSAHSWVGTNSRTLDTDCLIANYITNLFHFGTSCPIDGYDVF